MVFALQTHSTPVKDHVMKDPKAAATGGGDADLVKNGGVLPLEEMTSKDYYFDSYAHFGIHEVGYALGPGKQGNKLFACDPVQHGHIIQVTKEGERFLARLKALNCKL